uniref:Uncharacterized protein n=1 Tax=Sphaerodactylus townsendi TaxID=933632 RepID=A0ACB8FII2_9SAUR
MRECFQEQRYRWAFVPEVDTQTYNMTSDLMENHQEYKPHIVKILDLLKLKYGELNTNETTTKYVFPLLDLHSISSITQLMPFFRILSSAFKTENSMSLNTHSSVSFKTDCSIGNSTRTLKLLEDYVERDFTENMET